MNLMLCPKEKVLHIFEVREFKRINEVEVQTDIERKSTLIYLVSDRPNSSGVRLVSGIHMHIISMPRYWLPYSPTAYEEKCNAYVWFLNINTISMLDEKL